MTRSSRVDLGAALDLSAIAHELRGDDAYRREGHAARTLVRAQDLRVVLLAIRAGARIPEHAAATSAAIQAVQGRVRMPVPGPNAKQRIEELSPGRLLVLDPGVTHAVEALEDSALLVTLGWHEKLPA